jgi:hypothetical protein
MNHALTFAALAETAMDSWVMTDRLPFGQTKSWGRLRRPSIGTPPAIAAGWQLSLQMATLLETVVRKRSRDHGSKGHDAERHERAEGHALGKRGQGPIESRDPERQSRSEDYHSQHGDGLRFWGANVIRQTWLINR